MLPNQISETAATELTFNSVSSSRHVSTPPDLVVASLKAARKDKPCGVVTARVLFDGTHGISVNTRTTNPRSTKGHRLLLTSSAS